MPSRSPPLTLLLLIWPCACAEGAVTQVIDELDEQHLSLVPLVDGETTREDILLGYGIPSMKLEGDRILSYRLLETQEGLIVVSRELDLGQPGFRAWRDAELNLILVFDDRGVLEKHRMLRVRSKHPMHGR